VSVLAAGAPIEIYTRRPGDCRTFGEFRDEVECESKSWRGLVLQDCLTASCVREMRIEQDGEVLARSEPGRHAAFDLPEAYSAGTKLVIDGCGDPIELTLPEPKDDVELSFSADTQRIDLDVDGQSAGSFVKAGTYAFAEGHMVACQTDRAPARIPVSDAYSFYRAAAFVFDEPVVVRTDRVHAELFPSAHAIRTLSTRVDFGPLWDAAVAAAEASSLFDACAEACASATAACDDATDDLMPCAVPCVAAGETEPNCKAEYQAHVECAAANPTCESTATPSIACEQAEAAWTTCAEE